MKEFMIVNLEEIILLIKKKFLKAFFKLKLLNSNKVTKKSKLKSNKPKERKNEIIVKILYYYYNIINIFILYNCYI
jgi:hypothetical protein